MSVSRVVPVTPERVFAAFTVSAEIEKWRERRGVMRRAAALAIIIWLPIGGCSSESAAPGKLQCVLEPTTGSTVSGWVTFESMADHVHVRAEVKGLTPGRHGFHVHEKGDCSSGDGTSAGGHFNPVGEPHAGPDSPKRHVGDLGNLEANDAGIASYERMDFGVRLSGEHSILGKAVIVHAGEDDLTTQPTGAAGARVACGVIAEAP
jgi:Cu-Zn family superoxide dismutase